MGKAARAVGILPRLGLLDLWTKTVALTSPQDRRALFLRNEDRRSRIEDRCRVAPSSIFDPRSSILNSRPLDLISWFQYFDLKNYLPYDILTKVHIASMYHRLQVRFPFLHHKVV